MTLSTQVNKMVITPLVININFILETCTIVLSIDRAIYPFQNLNIHKNFDKLKVLS